MNLVKAEMTKTFREAFRYYADMVVGIVTDFLLLILVLRLDGSQTEKVLSYVFWILVNGVLNEASICISTEKQLGTLQNLMIKPNSILSIITVKTVVWFILSVARAVLLLFVATALFGLEGVFRLEYLCVAALVCFGTMGVSYILASLTLMFTKVATFVNIIGYLFLFLSGSIVRIPDSLIYTNPLSCGVMVMQQVNGGASFFQAGGSQLAEGFGILALISTAWFLAGLIFFKVTFARAKQFKWSY